MTATGDAAFFGKIAGSTKGAKRASTMERDILAISRFLIIASLIAIPFQLAIFVWIWAFFWMQVSEAMKSVRAHLFAQQEVRPTLAAQAV